MRYRKQAKHLIISIASPISTCAVSKLKCLNNLHFHKMRTCAKLRKLALLIKTDMLAFSSVFLNKFNLVRLILFFHKFNSLVGRKFKFFNRIIFLNNSLHFFFYFIKVILSEMSIYVKIVIKSVFNRRTDSKLGIWINPFNCLSHNVRCGMVKCLFPSSSSNVRTSKEQSLSITVLKS